MFDIGQMMLPEYFDYYLPFHALGIQKVRQNIEKVARLFPKQGLP